MYGVPQTDGISGDTPPAEDPTKEKTPEEGQKGSELSIDTSYHPFMIWLDGQAVAHRVSGGDLSCA